MAVTNYTCLLVLISVILHSNGLEASNSGSNSNYKLETVQILFREGDREPLLHEVYGNDPYNKEYSSLNTHLTKAGEIRSEKLGSMLRNEYGDFLSDNYFKTQVYAHSNLLAMNRESITNLLKGLYANSTYKNWNIDTLDTELYVFLLPLEAEIFTKKIDQIKKLPEVQERLAKHESYLNEISEKSGMKKDRVHLLNILFEAQHSMGIPKPEWLTPVLEEKLKEIYDDHYDIQCYSDELKKMSGGLWIRKFVYNVETKKHKLYLYSGNDFNLAHLQRALGINLGFPTFSSAIILEKYKNSQFQQFVQVKTWNGLSDEFQVMKIKDCDDYCPLEMFKYTLSSVTPTQKEIDNLLYNKFLELPSELAHMFGKLGLKFIGTVSNIGSNIGNYVAGLFNQG